ncbi:MAG: F0F1 ATP synthase subunit epsilon [Bacteroidales bacterium]|jgi:F-type H+-transporting ATPase subunit epsilon|nr:F0F1 ATP synthase subunit epsilon [Bacteroidales bacterium]MDD2204375.1 F0F1 ATP synthase subunit epsilon [Bacteroidales bacterium]MDD3152438.1 F0F1 ATP synthase subunit epsilon [Bacteroidales bacterium]MDD3913853.1 F0F1 ATP synthase subunit epsilon [Bacteroidales bacterium]MDD4634524.1 F0F1 ATP synthase subunit epsilon [Bacteroidales bacterium]
MTLKILSPEKTFYDGNTNYVLVPCINNRPFVILENHANMISALEVGIIKYKDNSDTLNELTISGGFLEIRNNVVSMCVEVPLLK